MKKLLKVIGIYLLIIITVTIGVNLVYLQFRKTGMEKFKQVPENIQICNFGTSHSQNGFNYEDIKDCETFNFALGSQYPSYDCRVLKNYFDHIESGGTVFMGISYFSFFGIPEEEQEKFPSKNKRYYHFLKRQYIKKYDFSVYLYECWFPTLTMDEKLFEGSEEGVEDEWARKTNAEEASHHALQRYKQHISSRVDENGNRIINQEEIDAVYEIIDLCKKNNIKIVLLTMPYLKEYQNTIREKDPDFFNDFYYQIDQITKNTGVVYYNYSDDHRFYDRYELFMNSDHLNREGARLFTDIVVEEIIGKKSISLYRHQYK